MIANQNDRWIIEGERFRKLLEELHLPQLLVAEIVGTKQSSISKAINGKVGIPKVWLYKLRDRYSKINDNWIWTGEGEMLKNIPDEKKSSDVLVMQDMTKYSNGRQLKKEEMEKMLARMAFRIEELEEWRREMEEWKKEVMTHLLNTKK